MRINNRQFPHPVLASYSDDIVGCEFKADFQKLLIDNFKYKVKIDLSNDDLFKLISEKNAYYAVHVECPSTRYRKLFKSTDNEFDIEVNADDLDSKVEICTFIVAEVDIDNYVNSCFNDDYDDISFNIKKGDILAVDKDRVVQIDKEIDPLKNFPSIFIITENKEKNPLDIAWEIKDKKIMIKLSKDNFRIYRDLKVNEALKPVLASMFVIPVLTELLVDIKQSKMEEYEEARWYRVIVRRLKSIGIDIEAGQEINDSAFSIAQQLLGSTLKNSLISLEEFAVQECV